MARLLKRVSVKPIVKEIRKAQRAVAAIKRSAAPDARRHLNLHLENLRGLERRCVTMCRADALPMPKLKSKR